MEVAVSILIEYLVGHHWRQLWRRVILQVLADKIIWKRDEMSCISFDNTSDAQHSTYVWQSPQRGSQLPGRWYWRWWIWWWQRRGWRLGKKLQTLLVEVEMARGKSKEWTAILIASCFRVTCGVACSVVCLGCETTRTTYLEVGT